MTAVLQDGEVYSHVVPGAGSQTLTFQLPGGGKLEVDAVIAQIDNTAGAATHPILFIALPDGSIIAKKPQGSVIPAGDTGTATWALRLTDDVAAAAGGGLGETGFYVNAGTVVGPGATVTLAWSFVGPDALLDLTVPTLPTFLTDGNYGLTGVVDVSASGVPVAGPGSLAELALLVTGGGPSAAFHSDFTVWGTGGFNPVRHPLALGAIFAKAGDTLRINVGNGQAVNMVYDFVATLHKLP